MITNTLSLFNLIVIVCMGCVVVHNFSRLKKYRTDKTKLYEKISVLYPLVKPEFYNKTIPQQVVENNHEIFEHEKRIETLEANNRILQGQIDVILEELKKNG